MIVEYNRPEHLDAALALLQRSEPATLPLAGGTALVRPSAMPIAVVDLQALGLNTLQVQGSLLVVGATATLEQLLNWTQAEGAAHESGPSAILAKVIRHEATYNLRQAASVAGTLVAASGRSPFATALLALDAGLALQPGNESLGSGDLLPVRTERLRGRLIVSITLPLNARLAYHYVARTPADRPLVCAAAARWPSDRVRVVVGGFGPAPMMIFDGTEPDGAEAAARSAYSAAGDAWASAEYRSAMAGLLVGRCLKEL